MMASRSQSGIGGELSLVYTLSIRKSDVGYAKYLAIQASHQVLKRRLEREVENEVSYPRLEDSETSSQF